MATVSEEQQKFLKDNLPKEIGAIIREIRISKKISQSRLAEFTNKDRQYIYKIEKGKVTPNIVTIAVLGKALDVSLKDIFEKLSQDNSGNKF